MNKTLLIFAIATMLSLSSYAQWSIGGSIGAVYDRPFLHQNKYEYYYYLGGFGYLDLSVNCQVDLSVLRQINDRWSVISGVSFQKKGYRMNTSNPCSIITSGASSNKYDDWYISLPMIMEFSFVKRQTYEFFVDAGAYVSFWCNSMRISSVRPELGKLGDRIVVIEKKEFDGDVDRRFECGMIGGVGYNHHFGTRWTGMVTARYQYAFTKQNKEPQTMAFLNRNNAFVFQLGLLYNL